MFCYYADLFMQLLRVLDRIDSKHLTFTARWGQHTAKQFHCRGFPAPFGPKNPKISP